jgi:hypothetical protein
MKIGSSVWIIQEEYNSKKIEDGKHQEIDNLANKT